ncbi:peptidase dimerization domain-containing protein [Janibacter sp. UYMM211]|uniref:peptidase dimerization domain-containing protein n=1 Tax=Janibacter sp. UYMM211 TaxID=3156342 RepID=UPI003390E24B
MSVQSVLEPLATVRTELEELYRDLHAHPELSHEEHRTAGLVAQRLRADGFDVHEGVGGTGVVGVLAHGEGPVVLLRADMRMVDDGLADLIPSPDVALGQHVLVAPAGHVGTRSGPVLSAADSLRVTIHGRGAHGSMPHVAVDPVVVAATAVVALQQVVSRDVAPTEPAVLTVGSIRAGTTANIIPDTAELLINIRTYDDDTRQVVLDGIDRVVQGICAAAGTPHPADVERYQSYPLTDNDAGTTQRVHEAFAAVFGDAVVELPLQSASEDFSDVPTALGVPYTYWGIGGTDPEVYRRAQEEGRLGELPVNHSPAFAPVVQPTLDTGVSTLVTAAMAWLAKGEPPAV